MSKKRLILAAAAVSRVIAISFTRSDQLGQPLSLQKDFD